jgi:LacI family transcriptional regulator, purine nucleotide synthesis repressor
MAAKKIGIREISEQAGVAISTVSHALNGTAPISEAVRNRVLSVARELGYLAKWQAKGAIAALSKLMIVVPEGALPDNDVNLVSWTILSALTRDCEARGLKVVPFSLQEKQDVSAVVAAAKSAGADGIILLNDDRNNLLEAVCDTGIPVVLINGEDPNMHVDSVTPGNRFAAQKAANWLISLGHRRIMHLTWQGRKTVRRRLDGFMDAIAEHDADGVVVSAGGFEPQFGESAVTGWLAENPDLAGVTAIFCAADNLAFGAIKALKAAGLRVPEDISVMGFDGVALGELHVPALTTVSIPLEQFGQEALFLLEQRALAFGGKRASHRLELGCEIVQRASVAAPKSR